MKKSHNNNQTRNQISDLNKEDSINDNNYIFNDIDEESKTEELIQTYNSNYSAISKIKDHTFKHLNSDIIINQRTKSGTQKLESLLSK